MENTELRATGRTTRQVDDYIQLLFTQPNVPHLVLDHWDNGDCKMANHCLLERIQRRLASEFPRVLYSVRKNPSISITLNH